MRTLTGASAASCRRARADAVLLTSRPGPRFRPQTPRAPSRCAVPRQGKSQTFGNPSTVRAAGQSTSRSRVLSHHIREAREALGRPSAPEGPKLT